MAHANPLLFSRYTNIVYMDEKSLDAAGITLYQLLGQADFLITDVSSVYFDYKYIERPVVMYCPDFSEYERSRGFIAPISSLIEEKVALNIPELTAELDALFCQPLKGRNPKEVSFKGGITRSLLKMTGAIAGDVSEPLSTGLRPSPRRVDIWHNILWSRYKGEIFSSLDKINHAEFNLRFIQMAESSGNRANLSGIDLNYHRYPYELMFKGTYENVRLLPMLMNVFRRTFRSNAELTVLAGFHRPEYWMQLFYLRLTRKKVAVFCDSTIHDHKPNALRGILKKIFFRLVHGIFCYGERSREYVIAYGAKPDYVFPRCQAAALPVDYSAEAAFARRLELASKPESPRYLYVGRLSPEKNIDRLLLAFSHLAAANPAATLVLVGSGPEGPKLEKKAQLLRVSERVTFMGSLTGEKLAEEYLKATCLMLPSLSEPWGLVINEALSYGCPVIVSTICGCVPELVIEGKTGFSHGPTDEEELTRKMALAPKHFSDIKVTAKNCLDLISTFSPDAAAAHILGGIRKILETHHE